jgi:hypothetical protein
MHLERQLLATTNHRAYSRRVHKSPARALGSITLENDKLLGKGVPYSFKDCLSNQLHS